MSQPYIGEIRMFGGNFAPAGWMLCQGQIISIAENETLFNLIGTTYGGNGQDTFALPNLASRVPVCQGQGPGLSPYPMGQMGGVEAVAVTSNQMPQHSHAMLSTTSIANATSAAGAVPAQTSTFDFYQSSPPSGAMAATAVQSVGGSQPHDNLQPYLCVNFIISLYGIFPTPT